MEAREHFDFLGEDGGPVKEFETIYRVIRKSDSKVFNIAGWFPKGSFAMDCCYLEEL